MLQKASLPSTSSSHHNINLNFNISKYDKHYPLPEREYCPTTWNYAYGYHTPNDYSDALFAKGAPAILAHESVLSVIAQMSNKNSRHAHCANAHAPSAVISGLIVSLTPIFQPKQPRPINLKEMIEFKSIADIRECLNETLSITQDFVKVPEARDACRILQFKPHTRKQYKTRPEQDYEELVFMFNQKVSMIETLELEEIPEYAGDS